MEAILFDVDGTIIDTEMAIKKSLIHILKKYYNLDSRLANLDFILGIPGKVALEKIGIPANELDKANEIWERELLSRRNETRLFPEVFNLLTELKDKNIKIGIVTSKTRGEVENDFTYYGLHDFFDIIVTATDTHKHKPDSEPLELSAKLLNIQIPEKILYIGDSIYDYECARNFGCKFGLATWGIKENILDERKKSDYFLESPLKLMEIL